MIPATFPVAPPKYQDAFPHEAPGQVAEMLMEGDLSDSQEQPEDNESEEHDNQSSRRASNARNTIEMEYGEFHLDRQNVYTI